MLGQLKKLVKKFGPAQVCVWLNMRDTRTLNQWLSRGKVPTYREEQVKAVIKEHLK